MRAGRDFSPYGLVAPVGRLFCACGALCGANSSGCLVHVCPAACAWLEVVDVPGADGVANEAQGGEADGGGHAADLAVAAFVEGELEPGGWDGGAIANGWISGPEPAWFGACLGPGWFGEAVFEAYAFAELLDGLLVYFAFDLDKIGFWKLVFGVGDLMVEVAFAGEDQEAFRVEVEAASRIDVRDVDEILQRRSWRFPL